MHPAYSDITSRIDEEPMWYDEHGCPRYGEFHPMALGVYDQYAVLGEVECQACGVRLFIGQGYTQFNHELGFYIYRVGQVLDLDIDALVSKKKLAAAFSWTLEDILEGWGWGDPPRHDCVGDAMSCIVVGIRQVWTRRPDPPAVNGIIPKGSNMDWRQVPELAREFPRPDWARPR